MKLENLSDDRREVLNTLNDVYKEKSINVISTSINQDISFERDMNELADSERIKSTLGQSFVFIKFGFKEGFEGQLGLVLSKSTVAQIADKMLMGEGDADFDPDEHLEAVQELNDQILGAAATEFTGLFEFPISFAGSQSILASYDEIKEMLSEADLITKYDISILDNSEVYFIVYNTTFENIVRKISDFSTDDLSPTKKVDALETTTIGSNMIGEVSSGRDLGLLMDVRLPISVELGRKKMFIRDILRLTPGEVVDLPKLQGEPVDLYVNDKRFATGEVVVIAENFGIRIKSLIKPEERLKEGDAWVDDLRSKTNK